MIGQYGGGNKNSNLFVIHNRFEGSPDGDFRFPESNITAYEAVHRCFRLHILLYGVNRALLVRRFLEGEGLLAREGYERPTPIQGQAIPPVLAGRDLLGIAQTGTGKTASFTLPMITILNQGRAKARMPRSLILCPTRELAAQVVQEVVRKLYIGLRDPDYNLIIRSGPVKEPGSVYFHWYVSLVPRVNRAAGFEMGSGMYINPSLPEASAVFLRDIQI